MTDSTVSGLIIPQCLQGRSPTAILCMAVGFLAFALSGCDDISTSSIPNQPPGATFTISADAEDPLIYSLDATGTMDTDTEGTIESYEWDFDDGETGSGKTVTHIFPEKGVYEVELTVVDDGGAEDTYQQRVSASARPNPRFTATPQKADPTQITFDAGESTDPDGQIESYSWNFGDGERGEGEIISHNYNFDEDRTVEVVLTAVDDIGTAETTTKSVAVDVPVFVPISKANWEVADFSSQQPDRPDRAAVLAIDGDDGTFWHTPWCCAEDEYGTSRPQPPHWIVTDMGETRTVYRLEITGRDGNYFNNPKQITLEFASEYNGDETNWQDAESFTLPFDADGNTIETTVSLEAPVDARYFKFASAESVDNDLLNLSELTAITTQEELQGD